MGSLSSPIQLVLSSGMKAGFHCETAIYVGRSGSAEAQLDLEPFLRCSSAWTAGEEAKKRHFRESLWPSGINARGNITLRRIRRFWVGGRQPLPWDYFLLARHPEGWISWTIGWCPRWYPLSLVWGIRHEILATRDDGA